jgi:stage IV sporulation protein FB
MGFEDRDYYREPGRPTGIAGVGHWLLYGRLPLFRAFGIHVQAHSSLLIVMGLTLLFYGLGSGYTWQDRLIASLMLFAIVLLHEFGHCFAARFAKGESDEIVMHPLGGLALTRPPFYWLAHFITTVGGPLVNVLICVVVGIALYALSGRIPWQPFYLKPFEEFVGWGNASWWCYWIYQTSWNLLLFNLIPIMPLDGGRMVQEVAWKFVGYKKSMLVSCNVGMVAAVVLGMVAIATGQLWMLLLCVMGFFMCRMYKQAAQQMDEVDPIDEAIAASNAQRDAGPSYFERRRQERERRQAEREKHQREEDEHTLDQILAKISVTRSEKRFLERVTEEKRRTNAEKPTNKK